MSRTWTPQRIRQLSSCHAVLQSSPCNFNSQTSTASTISPTRSKSTPSAKTHLAPSPLKSAAKPPNSAP